MTSIRMGSYCPASSSQMVGVVVMMMIMTTWFTVCCAFTVQTVPTRRVVWKTSTIGRITTTAATATAPTKAASNFEEDLQLTLAIIMDHVARSTTVTKDQFISQMESIQNIPEDMTFDISIPYDAAAQLAYNNAVTDPTQSSMSFDEFKVQYEIDSVAEVIAKRNARQSKAKPVVNDSVKDEKLNVSAAAASSSSAVTAAVVGSEETVAVAPVSAAAAAADTVVVVKEEDVEVVHSLETTPVGYDVSVPYDAAARNAYEALADKTTISFIDFKIKYEADAVADVIAKRQKQQQQQQQQKIPIQNTIPKEEKEPVPAAEVAPVGP